MGIKRYIFFGQVIFLGCLPFSANANYARLVTLLSEIRDFAKFQKLHNCNSLIKNTSDDPEMVSQLSQLLDVSNNYVSKEIKPNALREFLVTYLREPSRREYFTRVLKADLRKRSEELKYSILKSNQVASLDGKESASIYQNLFWDVIVIGAGIHDNVFNSVLEAEAKKSGKSADKLKVLTIERTNTVASLFEKKLININSSNRKSTNFNLPGDGNLNFLPENIIQLSDLSGAQFPTAKELAQTVLINRGLLDAEILFNANVTSVIEGSGIPLDNVDREALKINQNLLKLQRGGNKAVVLQFSGRFDRSVLFAKNIVVATGLGDPKKTNSENESTAFVDTKLDRPFSNSKDTFNSRKLARRYSFDKIQSLLSEKKFGLKDFANLEVIVNGYGDSGRTMIEYLLGTYSGSGNEDTKEFGQVKKIYWIIGKEPIESCKDFILKNRTRYALIAGGIKSGKIVLVSGRDIKEDIEKIQIVSGNEQDTGKVQVTVAKDEENKKLIADVLINAIGYNPFASLRFLNREFLNFAEEFNKNSRTTLKEVQDFFPKVSVQKMNQDGTRESIAVARSYRNQKGIYIIGPTFENSNPSEYQGVGANAVSIFVNAPRTALFAKDFFRVNKPMGYSEFDSDPSLYRDDLIRSLYIKESFNGQSYQSSFLFKQVPETLESNILVGDQRILTDRILLNIEKCKKTFLNCSIKKVILERVENPSADLIVFVKIIIESDDPELNKNLLVSFYSDPDFLQLASKFLYRTDAFQAIEFEGTAENKNLIFHKVPI